MPNPNQSRAMSGDAVEDGKTRYIIERTSVWDGRPCDEAIERKVARVERCTVTEAEFNKHFARQRGLWRSKGQDHGTYDWGHSSGITRRHPDGLEVWTLDLTPEEVIEFVKKYGKVVMSAHHHMASDYPCIEIYDGYRE